MWTNTELLIAVTTVQILFVGPFVLQVVQQVAVGVLAPDSHLVNWSYVDTANLT